MQKVFFACVWGSLLTMVGCAPKKMMPDGDLIGISYIQNAMMATNEYEGHVEQDSMGTFVLSAMKENYGPLFEKRIDAVAMKKFRQIIEEEHMYAYKESYQPRVQVYDGTMWHFSAVFSDGTSISSNGTNASPNGNGLARITELMMQLVEDGVQKADPPQEPSY